MSIRSIGFILTFVCALTFVISFLMLPPGPDGSSREFFLVPLLYSALLFPFAVFMAQAPKPVTKRRLGETL